MAMNPQSPKANAPYTLEMEPAVPVESAATEQPVPATERVIREQDRLMPVANVVRIMRRVLPPNAKIADEAKEVIQECVSEFISFVTGEANDRCHAEHRKTVNAEDIVWAMERLGFDNYVMPLRAYLQRMRDGTGRGFGGRAYQTRAATHGPQEQPVAFPNTTTLAHGYDVVLPPQIPLSAAQHAMLGGESSMAASYYRELAPVTDGSHGRGCSEETSSSNEEPPAEATTPRPQYPN